MSVVAKFKVNHVTNFEYGSAKVSMQPVMPSDDDDKITRDENERFWQATPTGLVELNINNPAAAEQFQAGDQYYLTFEKAT